MFDTIPDPISGKSILPWAVPVTRALNAIGDKVGATARNERDRRSSTKPLPFEVRWDATLNDKEGGYKIYLPTEHLLSYAGEDIATSDISGVTPILDTNGDDTAWSVLDDIDTSAAHVWLVIRYTTSTVGSGSAAAEAEFAAAEGQPSSGEEVVNICIAEVDYTAPEQEGETATVEINQSVVGALHLQGDKVLLVGNDSSSESEASEALVRPKIMFSNAQDQSGNAIANVSITAEEDEQDSSLTHVKIGVFYV